MSSPAACRTAVRVLIDPSAYWNRNIGDMAMLQVALARLRSFWPQAVIEVMTLDPRFLQRLDPEIRSLDPYGSLGWSADAVLVGRSVRLSASLGYLLETCRGLRRRTKWLMTSIGRAALLVTGQDPRLVSLYLDAVRRADLVLMTGAGILNESFKRYAFVRLETLELAMEAGASTVLLGQGIGPISDPKLQLRAAQVLSRVDLLALRDGAASLGLLNAMGVLASRIRVTGDDAVAIAYCARQEAVGSAIGINLRSAFYAGVEQRLAREIGRIVRDAADRHGAPLVPLPISRHPEEDDLRTIHAMLDDASIPRDAEGGPRTPDEFLSLLPQCRIVVAGSYHAAVLALSMGIPTVGIACSDYYVHKFRGLADQFGSDCRVELTSDPAFHTRLQAAIDAAWVAAEEARPRLLSAAHRQMVKSEAAYGDLFALVEARRRRSTRIKWSAATRHI